MKCEVCGAEIRFSSGECPECQALTETLRALREEPVPALNVRIPGHNAPRPAYAWIAAAAAAAIMLATLPRLHRTEPANAPKHPDPQVAPENFARQEERTTLAEPAKIKILTPDPDVVIYWVVSKPPKEGKL